MDSKAGRWNPLQTGLISAHNNVSLGTVRLDAKELWAGLFLSPEDRRQQAAPICWEFVGSSPKIVMCFNIIPDSYCYADDGGKRDSRVGASLAAIPLGLLWAADLRFS